ncbi:MAG TPA: DNA-binding protein WhiA [Candidatus Egerieimonas intestinavium]|uniref:Probable cell division protein WhiA n=1 Tax=Candidatus Egerieimonas intestinavium TaxID=2840777 RepID=A0A9D1EI59_9FIRM|nr:DNA-binding protein WhiA [Candidatus Egerieimonas intestinavium]
MSFSGEVKEELSRQYPAARHCQIAEVAAMLCLNGRVARNEAGEFSIIFSTENESVAKKYFTLLRKTFKIDTEIFSGNSQGPKRGNTYSVSVSDHEKMMQILKATKMLSPELERTGSFPLASELILQQNCCRRAYLRGAFLMSGSISDPEKFYHFELVCSDQKQAGQLKELIRGFSVDAKVVERKKYYVVYVKEGAQIVELLGLMGAGISLMKLENVRILKEMRNSVNRKVNCETANINKTVHAALKQMEDIRYIRDMRGLSSLPEGLEEIARLRLEFPEATLKELGMMLKPPVGKSGVNHRLRKISEIADGLKGNKEELL